MTLLPWQQWRKTSLLFYISGDTRRVSFCQFTPVSRITYFLIGGRFLLSILICLIHVSSCHLFQVRLAVTSIRRWSRKNLRGRHFPLFTWDDTRSVRRFFFSFLPLQRGAMNRIYTFLINYPYIHYSWDVRDSNIARCYHGNQAAG